MSNPLQPRVEQVRQAILLLLGEPDTTLATLGELLSAGNAHAAATAEAADATRDIILHATYSNGEQGQPPAGQRYAEADWNWKQWLGSELFAFFPNANNANSAAVANLPLIAALQELMTSANLINSLTRDAVYFTPSGGGAPQGIADHTAQMRGLLDDLLVGQANQTQLLNTMSETLLALLECCQEGGGGGPVVFDYLPESCGAFGLQWPASAAETYIGGGDQGRQYAIEFDTSNGGAAGIAVQLDGTGRSSVFANLDASGPRQICIARATNETHTDGTYRFVWQPRAPADGVPPSNFVFTQGSNIQFDPDTRDALLLLPPPDEFGRYVWCAIEYREVAVHPAKPGAPGVRLSVGAVG